MTGGLCVLGQCLVRRRAGGRRPPRRPGRPAHTATPSQTTAHHAHRLHGADLDGQRHDPDGDALDDEHLADGGADADLRDGPAEQLLVARVLAVSGAALADVSGEPGRPERDDHRQDEPAQGHVGLRSPSSACATKPATSATTAKPRPQTTSTTATRSTRLAQIAVPAIITATRPGRPRDDQELGPVHVAGLPVADERQRVRPPGRTMRIWSTPIRPSRNAIAPPTR